MKLVRASANLIKIGKNWGPAPNNEEKEPTDGIKSVNLYTI